MARKMGHRRTRLGAVVNDATTEQAEYLRKWYPLAERFRRLRAVTIQLGYCETCWDSEAGVNGQALVKGAWVDFIIPARMGRGDALPGYADLLEPDDPADRWEDADGDCWREDDTGLRGL